MLFLELYFAIAGIGIFISVKGSNSKA